MAVLKATTINGNLSVSSSLTTSGMIPISNFSVIQFDSKDKIN